MALADSLSKRERVLVADSVLSKTVNGRIGISDVLANGQDIEYVFDTYSFDTVLFIPPRLERMAAAERGSYSQLLRVLQACESSSVKQVIFLSSAVVFAEGDATETSDHVGDTSLCALLNACEQLCDMYRRKRDLNVTVLHVPSLFSDTASDCLLNDAADAIRRHKPAILPGTSQSIADFLHVDDLADFLFRFHDEPLPAATYPVINLPGTGSITFEKIAEWLNNAFPNARVKTQFEQDTAMPSAAFKEKKNKKIPIRFSRYPVSMRRQTARHEYDWQAYITPMEKAETLLPALMDGSPRQTGTLDKVRRNWKRPLLVALELLLVWGLSELLQKLASDSMLLHFLDCRLLFVVIIAIVHGMRPGIVAALCATVSYTALNIVDGARWQAMFMDFSNWLPAMVYFLTAAVVGYTKNRLVARYEEEKERREAIEEKYIFLYDLYNKALEIKEKLKDQIMGYSDGYGRFLKAVQMLDSMLPSEIYRNAINCMEDFLDNRSIAVYSVDETAHFGRLQMYSPTIADSLKASFDFSEHPDILEQVYRQRVFCNQTFTPGEPAFCTAIYGKDEIVAVIMIWSAQPEQYSTDYINKIHVMTGLVQIAVVRALDYLNAVEDERYLPGTHIMREKPFVELCKTYRETREKNMAEFRLLRVCTKLPIEQLDKLIQPSIRQTDTVGIGRNGTLYIMLAQANETGVEITKRRLQKNGVICE